MTYMVTHSMPLEARREPRKRFNWKRRCIPM